MFAVSIKLKQIKTFTIKSVSQTNCGINCVLCTIFPDKVKKQPIKAVSLGSLLYVHELQNLLGKQKWKTLFRKYSFAQYVLLQFATLMLLSSSLSTVLFITYHMSQIKTDILDSSSSQKLKAAENINQLQERENIYII